MRGVRLDYGEGQETAEVQERFLSARADPLRGAKGKKKSARCARNDVRGVGRGARNGRSLRRSLPAWADPLQEARGKKKSAHFARNDVRGSWAGIRPRVRRGVGPRSESMVGVIIKDPNILGGEPVFCGSRVPFKALTDYLEGGDTLGQFLEQYSSVSRELAVAAIEEVRRGLGGQIEWG